MLNPNYVNWPFGAALMYVGKSRWAIEVLKAFMRLDPFYGPMPECLLGAAHYMIKQYARAVPVLRNCVFRAPKLRSAHAWLAATYAQMGRFDEALKESAEVIRLEPTYTISGTAMRIMAFKHAKDAKHMSDGLRKAGLPE